jgi:hypothetical protein
MWACQMSILSEIRWVIESGLRKIKHGSPALVAFHNIKMVDTARSSHSRRAHATYCSLQVKYFKMSSSHDYFDKNWRKRAIRSIGRAWLKVKKCWAILLVRRSLFFSWRDIELYGRVMCSGSCDMDHAYHCCIAETQTRFPVWTRSGDIWCIQTHYLLIIRPNIQAADGIVHSRICTWCAA